MLKVISFIWAFLILLFNSVMESSIRKLVQEEVTDAIPMPNQGSMHMTSGAAKYFKLTSKYSKSRKI